MAFNRPESFYESTLSIGIADGGSESTLTLSSVPNETTGYLVIKQGSGVDARKEVVKYTGVSASTVTGLTRGLALNGATGVVLSETSVTANKKKFSAGATVEMADVHYYIGNLLDWATNLKNNETAAIKIGNAVDEDIQMFADNADGNLPFLMYDASENLWVFSDDGINTVAMGTGGSGVTAGDGISITASVVAVDLATDPGLEFSSNQLRVKTDAGIARTASGLKVGDVAVDFTSTFSLGGVAVTSTSAELNKLDGTSANVTATNLNTNHDGGSANALHNHDASRGSGTFADQDNLAAASTTDLVVSSLTSQPVKVTLVGRLFATGSGGDGDNRFRVEFVATGNPHLGISFVDSAFTIINAEELSATGTGANNNKITVTLFALASDGFTVRIVLTSTGTPDGLSDVTELAWITE